MIKKDYGVRLSHSINIPKYIYNKYYTYLANMDQCLDCNPANIDIKAAKDLLSTESEYESFDFTLSKTMDNKLSEKSAQFACTKQEYILACINVYND